jgi:L-asparagine transporter-like permease
MFGELGVTLTIVVAVVATVSGIIASMFAVSRMLKMLTDMELVPHKHFGMPGSVQTHVLVYIAVIAGLLTISFDVGRIAALGAFYYLVMDILIHFGVLKYADRSEVKFNVSFPLLSILVDCIILVGLLSIKIKSDPPVVIFTGVTIMALFIYEHYFLKDKTFVN